MWNVFGTGAALGFIKVPVIKVKGAMARDAWERADANFKHVRGCGIRAAAIICFQKCERSRQRLGALLH